MGEEFLGVELLELYRRLRDAKDPAVKAVIRQRIDSRLAQAQASRGGRRPALSTGSSRDGGAD